MCDPLTIASLAIGAAGTAANTIGRANAQKQQEQEFNSWQQYQERNRELEKARQEKLRADSNKTVRDSIADVGAENQAKIQSNETSRLRGSYLDEAGLSGESGTPEAVADRSILSGQQSGGEVFQTDMARALSDATASARSRLGALAAAQSYGGSSGGLGTVIPLTQKAAAADVNLNNNFRQGSMLAYGTEQAVEPTQVTYSNPLADLASGFLGAGMAGLGKAVGSGGGLGSLFSGAVTGGPFPAAPAAPAGIYPWQGLTKVGATLPHPLY